ncbi:MAG: hypothetical protein M3Y56_09960 [Armatimonadota bacterium]|nr:hypothetical protein [Armatimonadota bacterium]
MPKPKFKKPAAEQGKWVVAPEAAPVDDRLVFALRCHNTDFTLEACTSDEKVGFADKLNRLSQMTWTQIYGAHRHGLGCEKINRDSIKAPIPPWISEDVDFMAFRFFDRAPMVGYRIQSTFYIIWFDREFKLYDH